MVVDKLGSREWLITNIILFFLVWSWISEPWAGCNLLFGLEWYTFRLGVTYDRCFSVLARDFSEFYPTAGFLFLLKSAAPYSCKRGPPFMMSWWLFFFFFFLLFATLKSVYTLFLVRKEKTLGRCRITWRGKYFWTTRMKVRC